MRNKFILFLLIIFFLPIVYASFPGIPHAFYGEVYVEGVPFNNGVLTTKINNELVAEGAIFQGEYGYDPVFLIEDPNHNFNGKEITFYVNGVKAIKYIFEKGGVTHLDIDVEEVGFPVCGNSILEEGEQCDLGLEENGNMCDNSQEDCQYCSNLCEWITLEYEEDEGESESNVIQYVRKDKSAMDIDWGKFCSPNWVCSGWGECDKGIMDRTCKDSNNCEVSYNKPYEETSCVVGISEKSLVEPNSKDNFYLGLFGIIGIFLIVILAFLINLKKK